jgi:hypothetical protein
MALGGARPGAGRKPVLAELTVKQLCEKSADIVMRWLDSNEVPDEKKIQVCAEFLKRRIPNATEIDGKLDTGATNYILIRNTVPEIEKTQSQAG